jgi:hypothetical protein
MFGAGLRLGEAARRQFAFLLKTTLNVVPIRNGGSADGGNFYGIEYARWFKSRNG